jgi:hypothetical protein
VAELAAQLAHEDAKVLDVMLVRLAPHLAQKL